jgi:hypothetical protein
VEWRRAFSPASAAPNRAARHWFATFWQNDSNRDTPPVYNVGIMETPVAGDLSGAYLGDIIRSFRHYKALGEAALAQVASDADLHAVIDPGSNSIAMIVKHISGNLRSRFTNFLTSDGEKPDRDRDGEFEMPVPASREEVLQWWQSGFTAALGSIEALEPRDLTSTVHIRGEAFLVVEALNRLVTHLAYHVGQIVYVARHLAAARWTTLSIPKGQSKQFGTGTFKDGIIPRKPS